MFVCWVMASQKIFTKASRAENALITIGNNPYRVLGVMESKGASLINRMDNMVIIPILNAQKIMA